jgi:hypothetical protein
METLNQFLQTLVQLLDALAWPAIVFIVALFFRKELKAMLNRVSHISLYKFEASLFEEHLRSAERQVSELPSSEAPGEHADVALKELDQLRRTTAISPRATILESWIEIERAISELAERLPITEPGRRTPYKLMREFEKLKFVTNEALAAYNDLSKLRNEAAHAADFSVTFEDADRYSVLASELVGYLDRIGSMGKTVK